MHRCALAVEVEQHPASVEMALGEKPEAKNLFFGRTMT
jgi:hypothetical protein